MDRPKRSLKDLLDQNVELSENDVEEMATEPELNDTEENELNCVECGDQPRDLRCVNCDEFFCQVCFDYLHRTGKRKAHAVEKFDDHDHHTGKQPKEEDVDMNEGSSQPQPTQEIDVDEDEGVPEEEEGASLAKQVAGIQLNSSFVPMRLTMEERKLFRLLVAALEVSEYTDRVDIFMYASKAKRIVRELREICTVLTGLVVANGMDIGKLLVDDGDFAKHAEWFQSVFEVGRRYKIMNPERMRSSYGKLVYMIMDSRLPEVKQVLDFDLYKPILTVHNYLESKNLLGVLEDPRIVQATAEISAHNKPRVQIQREIRTKERAIEQLVRVFGEDVRQALYSLGDYHAYLTANRTPVQSMLHELNRNYDPDTTGDSDLFNLGIRSGRNGARLSHNHQKQYQYVLQSLTLWHEIMSDMFLLWKLADDDLLSDKVRYRLEDTGQGLNRVKSSPQVSRRMHTIISRAQYATGRWVGSSVVHLGDRAVPNSLFFLDKYLQVPRILNPVYTVLRLLPSVLDSDNYAAQWANTQFGSVEVLTMVILTDFFRYAFDGSGADNFYDAGSCIDGRLTSAWNWANQLGKKPYHKFFLITGFIGFDGAEGF